MTASRRLSRRIVQSRNRTGPLLATLAVVTALIVCGTIALHIAPGVTPASEAKILGIAIAVGLDVFALSIAVGVMELPLIARVRLGVAVSTAEVVMQLVGYLIGNGAGHIVGTVAVYAGFAILAGVGAFIVRESFQANDASKFKVDSGWGLLIVCTSVSLDSLGIGVSLPGVPLPLMPLLATVAISTILFTSVGLVFGGQLGQRYKQLAERIAGIVLIGLAVFFTAQHLLNWGT